MPHPSRFTPLHELEYAVLDTETTGLDVNAARLVEIGAVRGTLGELARGATFHTLIAPGVRIPPSASAIHHIDDARVADAPPFREVAAKLWEFIGARVIVGQSIGFDLAVLWHEMRRAGLPWPAPIFLDTKLLASALEHVETELALDDLARRLGVEMADRHSALSDAHATAEVFARLVPRLEAAGITTLGDAIARANAQHRIRARQIADGWYDATFLPTEDGFTSGADRTALARLACADNFAYRHRLEHVMRREPMIVAPSLALSAALRVMDEANLHALLVGDAQSRRADGLLTERVVVETMARRGADGFAVKLEEIMISPVETLPQDAFVYRALGRMQRLGLSYIAVDDGSGRIVGLVSEHRLLVDPTTRAVALGDRLSAARNPFELRAARAELLPLAATLRADGVDALEIADVASFDLRELIGRAAALAEKRVESTGAGLPPVPYALLALGDAGRGECLLDSTPSIALVFDSGDPGGVEDRWFAAFAEQLDQILSECGFASSAIDIRPSHESWRASLSHWVVRVARWSDEVQPGAELFCDGRWVFGDRTLARDLEALALAQLERSPRLVHWLADRVVALVEALPKDPGASPALDLYEHAFIPLVATARVLAMRRRSRARSTAERFAEARATGVLAAPLCAALIDAHATVVALALDAELTDLTAGRVARPVIRPAELDEDACTALALALDRVRELPATLATLGLAPHDDAIG